MADSTDQVDFSFSAGFSEWLSSLDGSLMCSSYQAGRLLSIGTNDGKPWIRPAAFKKCMGFYERNGAMVATTSNRIILSTFLEGDTRRDPFDLENDRVYYPRMAWFTGDLKTHDVVLTKDDSIVFVNTAYDCLATVDVNHSFRPIWYPPFLKPTVETDRCHLNGLCLKDGEPAYVTALGKSSTSGGWREHKRAGGLLMDVRSNEIISSSLSMPHSPRLYQGKLWLLDSGSGYFGYIDTDSGQFEPVTFCPGFARGLSFHKNWAVVGLSNMRRYEAFNGLALGETLEKEGISPVCGIVVINLTNGKIEHWMGIDGGIQELYDVTFVSGSQRPIVVTPEQRSTHDIVLLPNEIFEGKP